MALRAVNRRVVDPSGSPAAGFLCRAWRAVLFTREVGCVRICPGRARMLRRQPCARRTPGPSIAPCACRYGEPFQRAGVSRVARLAVSDKPGGSGRVVGAHGAGCGLDRALRAVGSGSAVLALARCDEASDLATVCAQRARVLVPGSRTCRAVVSGRTDFVAGSRAGRAIESCAALGAVGLRHTASRGQPCAAGARVLVRVASPLAAPVACRARLRGICALDAVISGCADSAAVFLADRPVLDAVVTGRAVREVRRNVAVAADRTLARGWRWR